MPASPTSRSPALKQDETFWNVQEVTVQLAVKPQLGDGDTVTITLGRSKPGSVDGFDRHLQETWTGASHTVNAVLQSADGVTMTAKQNYLLHPARDPALTLQIGAAAL